jgi:hypothetical protein
MDSRLSQNTQFGPNRGPNWVSKITTRGSICGIMTGQSVQKGVKTAMASIITVSPCLWSKRIERSGSGRGFKNFQSRLKVAIGRFGQSESHISSIKWTTLDALAGLDPTHEQRRNRDWTLWAVIIPHIHSQGPIFSTLLFLDLCARQVRLAAKITFGRWKHREKRQNPQSRSDIQCFVFLQDSGARQARLASLNILPIL